jgi:hypothetical protein
MSSSMLKVDDLSKRAEIMRGGKNSTLKHKETANTFAFRFLHVRLVLQSVSILDNTFKFFLFTIFILDVFTPLRKGQQGIG